MFAKRVADSGAGCPSSAVRGEDIERACQHGKTLGPPRKLRPGQVEEIQRMQEGGASLRRIASDHEQFTEVLGGISLMEVPVVVSLVVGAISVVLALVAIWYSSQSRKKEH